PAAAPGPGAEAARCRPEGDCRRMNDQQPHVIASTAIYSLVQAQQALGLRKSTLAREIREGRLRVAKRAGKYFVLGAWLLAWVEGGELKRRAAVLPAAGQAATDVKNGTKSV